MKNIKLKTLFYIKNLFIGFLVPIVPLWLLMSALGSFLALIFSDRNPLGSLNMIVFTVILPIAVFILIGVFLFIIDKEIKKITQTNELLISKAIKYFYKIFGFITGIILGLVTLNILSIIYS